MTQLRRRIVALLLTWRAATTTKGAATSRGLSDANELISALKGRRVVLTAAILLLLLLMRIRGVFVVVSAVGVNSIVVISAANATAKRRRLLLSCRCSALLLLLLLRAGIGPSEAVVLVRCERWASRGVGVGMGRSVVPRPLRMGLRICVCVCQHRWQHPATIRARRPSGAGADSRSVEIKEGSGIHCARVVLIRYTTAAACEEWAGKGELLLLLMRLLLVVRPVGGRGEDANGAERANAAAEVERHVPAAVGPWAWRVVRHVRDVFGCL